MRINNERIAEVVRFVINGGISFFVEYGTLFFLTEYIGIYYLVSSAISFAIALFVNYIICIVWVFHGTKNSGLKSKVIFAASSIIGLLINQFIMWFFVEQIGVYYMYAKIISTVIVMVWNFVMKKRALVSNKGEST